MKRLLIISLLVIAAGTLSAQDSIPASAVKMQKHCGLNRFYVDSARVSLDRLIVGCGANERRNRCSSENSSVWWAVFWWPIRL